METKMESLTVESLVAWREEDFMMANPEYQRGEVWSPGQQKKLIDSIFRGYQLPIHLPARHSAGVVRQNSGATGNY